MKGYYPEYYLRKRQREQAYRKVLVVLGTLGILALAITTGVIIFNNVFLTRRIAPGTSASMAAQRQQLELDEKLKDNENKPFAEGLVADSGANQVLDLNASDYAQSFPLVQVSVDGFGTSTSPTAAETSQTTPADAAAAGESPGSMPASGGADTSNASQTLPAAPVSTPGGTSAQPTQPPANTADKQTPAEQKPAEKKPEEQAQKPQDKPKKEEEKKPAPTVKPEEKKPEGSGSNAGSGKKVYRVYAGLCTTREDADKLKEKASAAGVSASVVKNGGDFLLLVSTVGSGDDAFALRDKLKGSGFNGAFVTQATQKAD